MPAIQVSHIAKSFGQTPAVADVSFAVEPGAILGLLGPNGAGKTTIIRLLLGLLEPSAGRIDVLGFDIRTQAHEVRARTGVLLEHAGLYEQLTAEDNLEFYGRVWRLPAADRQTRVKGLLTRMGLWERRQERVGTWSRGMKQQLALARALLHRPPLVLLGEPTAGLDVVAAAAVRDDLAALAAAEGVTVLLTTHNLAEAERLCEQVAVIRQGHLVAMGRPDELRARASGPRLEIFGRGFDDAVLSMLRARIEVLAAEMRTEHLVLAVREGTDVAPLISLLVRAGVQVKEIRRDHASLEETFLALMKKER